MTRILIHVEGQTEETFVNEVLSPHLYESGYVSASARLMGNSRQRRRRGGVKPWDAVLQGIVNHLREDPGSVVGLMVDYYEMPDSWPGHAEAANHTPAGRAAATIEDALVEDVIQRMGDGFDPKRFAPYVMMHEFEAILFSDCRAFAYAIGRPDLDAEFQAIRDEFDTPEEIDDSPSTAPSKRIQQLLPGYNKPRMGTIGASEIGLDRIRQECPHFRGWLERLEELG